jgi:hypothetical protein
MPCFKVCTTTLFKQSWLPLPLVRRATTASAALLAFTNAVIAAPSGSATTLVALGGLRDRSFELASLTAQHAFPNAEQKEQLNDFQNKQCKEAIMAKDFAGFIKIILGHNAAVFASGSDEGTCYSVPCRCACAAFGTAACI